MAADGEVPPSASGLARRDLLLAGAAATLVPWPGHALAAPATAQNRRRYDAVGRLMTQYVKDRRIAGAVFAIGRNSGDTDFLAHGYSAMARGQFLNEESLFRIYSMTKPITAVAAMILIEEGRLKLDQNIADIFPGFAKPRVIIGASRGLESRPATRPITVRHLLTHSSGLGYTINGNGPVEQEYTRLGLVPGQRDLSDKLPRPPSLAAFADLLATVPLLTDPGTRWHYSLSLDLMGAIVERVADQPFNLFLKERIFDPLGMADTGFTVAARRLPRLVANYLVTREGLRLIDGPPDSVYGHMPAFPFGGSGLVSSARDYARFCAMLLGEGQWRTKRIIAAETARLMMSNLLPEGVAGPDGQGFGAGGKVLIHPDGTGQGIGTYGWAGAAGTMMWVDPVYKVHATWLAQYMPLEALPVQRTVPRAAYEDLSRPS